MSFPQWEVLRPVDDFTDQESAEVTGVGDGKLLLLISCVPTRSVSLGVFGGGVFQSGTVDVRVEGKPIEQYEFMDLDTTLVLSSTNPETNRFIDLLLSEDEVRFRVRQLRKTVTGRFGLDGFAKAMAEAGCE